MAYMSQDHKKEINSLLKVVIPKEIKFSLSVKHHSNICLKVKSDKLFLELIDHMEKQDSERVKIGERSYFSGKSYYAEWGVSVNPYHYESVEIESKPLWQEIMRCLNHNNYNDSDYTTDYFNVGHYVEIKVFPLNNDSISVAA